MEFQKQGWHLFSDAKPRMLANDLQTLIRFAEAGLGLAYIYAEAEEERIERGTLIEVLKGKALALPRYSINYHSKRHMPARLRAFIDMAKSVAA
ncbi:MAG: LysR substrate-binding domain-containing protein [Parasphingorhabdus sp.]